MAPLGGAQGAAARRAWRAAVPERRGSVRAKEPRQSRRRRRRGNASGTRAVADRPDARARRRPRAGGALLKLMLTGGQAVVRALLAASVDHAFCVPGESFL